MALSINTRKGLAGLAASILIVLLTLIIINFDDAFEVEVLVNLMLFPLVPLAFILVCTSAVFFILGFVSAESKFEKVLSAVIGTMLMAIISVALFVHIFK